MDERDPALRHAVGKTEVVEGLPIPRGLLLGGLAGRKACDTRVVGREEDGLAILLGRSREPSPERCGEEDGEGASLSSCSPGRTTSMTPITPARESQRAFSQKSRVPRSSVETAALIFPSTLS